VCIAVVATAAILWPARRIALQGQKPAPSADMDQDPTVRQPPLRSLEQAKDMRARRQLRSVESARSLLQEHRPTQEPPPLLVLPWTTSSPLTDRAPPLNGKALEAGLNAWFMPLQKQCYRNAESRRPSAIWYERLRFRIIDDPGGGSLVDEASLVDDTRIDDTELRTCLVESMMTMTFDRPLSPSLREEDGALWVDIIGYSPYALNGDDAGA
jgi:hypothetical protein